MQEKAQRNRVLQQKLKVFMQKSGSSPRKTSKNSRHRLQKSQESALSRLFSNKNNENFSSLSPKSERIPQSPSKNSPLSKKIRQISLENQAEDPENTDLLITKRRYSHSPREFSPQNREKNKFNRQKSPKNEKFNEIRIIEGYDSDPEYDYHSPKLGKTRKNINKNLSFSQDKKEKPLKITVPAPFLFDERDNTNKIKRMLEEKTQKSKVSHTFRANPVPEIVKQRNLLEKLNKEQELRREEVKKNSKLLTKQREKPFSFYERDLKQKKIRKKNKFEREKFKFKANPVPWYCSIPLLKKMNEEENAKREERVAKQAQITLNLAKLPPRMEKHQMEKVC